jgi:hypothetical protein
MNLAEEVIVAGLTGRAGPIVPGDRFVFVEYDTDGDTGVLVRGEGETAFLAFLRGVRHKVAEDDSDDLTRREGFAALPEEVRKSGERSLILFLLGAVGKGSLMSFTTRSSYLDDCMAEALPEAECVFAWDAEPPLHEGAFGVYSIRPVTFSPAWRTDTVRALARQTYESGDFEAMPILADALQDAGCDDEAVLNHCRCPCEHTRGCWVVRWILGMGLAEAEPRAAPDRC